MVYYRGGEGGLPRRTRDPRVRDLALSARRRRMAKESRDAVVSVRISEDDQARLRKLATERGTSVSELVRTVVVREVSETVTPPRAAGVTSGAAPRVGTTTAAQQ